MNRIKRPVAATVLFTFLATVLQPLSVLAQDRPQSAASRRAAETGEEKFSRTLNEIHEILKEVAPQAAMPHMFPRKPGEMELRAIGPNMKIEVEAAKHAPGVDTAKKLAQLREKAKELASLEQHVRAGFDDTARHIKEKNLPAEILARHEEALKAYETRAAEFKGHIAAVEHASGAQLQSALNDLAAFMAKYPNQKTHTPTDPENLPWRSPKPVTREPYTRPSQFRTSKLFGEPIRVAQAGGLSGISLPSTTLPATPVPTDTAPTEDVQITQAIRDLAASLNNNPVQIYNWVRNNIVFVPSYGSIQGSDMTLQTKRGNAFDTASLLIALFRAANIPARYVYGTIEVPADKAMNWVGGVTAPAAAINLIGQGGIPAIGVTQSGVVRWVRLEHVWVEAFVDYLPSRGGVHRAGDTWVPMDASFKQYQYTQGMDIRANVPVDAQALLTELQQGAVVNEAEGWVSNVNQGLIQQAATNYQTRLTNYINSQNSNASIGDVIGTQTIVQENRPIFLGTLPYARIATGAKFHAIPDNLRWRFRYNVYATDLDRALDSPFISLERPTTSLAGKKITLSFPAATPQDQATIDSFLPRPQPGALPTSFPAYLIRLVPELRVDGQITATGAALTAGTELIQDAAYFNPSWGQWESGEANRPVAGEFIATALDLQEISQSQFTSLKTRLEQTKAKISQFQANPSDPTPIQTLTREAISGDLLYSTLLSYFVAIDMAGKVAARSTGVETQRMPSFGNFGTASQVQFFFGLPRTIGFPAVQMDVDRVVGSEVAKDATGNPVLAFRRAVGAQYSAFEHLIPEQAFRNSSLPANDPLQPQGVSAVKALAVAASQGQRIYTLNAANQAIHASAISQLSIDASVRQEIANALASGKEVTVHQASINYAGFLGSGYIIIDPETGAGAYKISGGANGDWMTLVQGLMSQIAGFLSLISERLGVIVDAINTIITIIDALINCPSPLGAWIAGLAIAFFVAGVLFSAVIGIVFGLVAAVLAGFLFGALIGAWLDALRNFRCT